MRPQRILKDLVTSGRSGAADLGRFWVWWLDEVKGMLPAYLQQALNHSEHHLVVAPAGRWANVSLHNGTDGNEVVVVDLQSPAPDETEQTRLRIAELLPLVSEIVVKLPTEQLLSCDVSMPQDTEARLDDVLNFEMDRLTPFKAEQVYFDYQILSRDRRQGTVCLNLTVALRSVIDPLLARLSEYGLKPSAIQAGFANKDEQHAQSQGNLLPRSRRSRPARARARLNQTLGIVVVGLLVAVMALPFVFQHNDKVELEGHLGLARTAAQEAQQTREQLDELLRKSGFLVAERNQRPTSIELMHELTRIIPNDTWLTRVQIRGARLKIQGESNQASALIRVIENSESFSEARFASPVTRDPRTARDRFSLEADIGRRDQGS